MNIEMVKRLNHEMYNSYGISEYYIEIKKGGRKVGEICDLEFASVVAASLGCEIFDPWKRSEPGVGR